MDSIYTQELLDKLSSILVESDFEDDEDGDNDENIKFIKVEDGDWFDEGKWSYRDDTFFFTDLNVYVNVGQSRSGSYYTDYYYDDPSFSFVEPKTQTVVTTIYVQIKVTQ
ncbi:Nucleotide reductase subunit C [Yersinia phage fHe-Yen9-03]|uniref:Nucleotide reductase subunit C n=1 Tax=Yersinia phage fHe-Yen9-03 TaxID=2052743 RepID=A0A2C9D0I9_9CAUD|nr:Nucleotide reductase subunit C [Yersinia phage fHe-Yen9-03]